MDKSDDWDLSGRFVRIAVLDGQCLGKGWDEHIVR